MNDAMLRVKLDERCCSAYAVAVSMARDPKITDSVIRVYLLTSHSKIQRFLEDNIAGEEPKVYRLGGSEHAHL